MSDLLIGLLSTLLATNQAGALSNLVTQKTGLTVNVPDPNDPVEREYQKLMAEDDAALAEADQWITKSATTADKASDIAAVTLRARVKQRLADVRKSYESFLERHPNHSRARLAFGSFLNDQGEENDAFTQWEKALQLDTNNPATWNNLANVYGHRGDTKKAFEYYGKALELAPNEPLYYENLATSVYAFRLDAADYFKVSVPEVLEKAFALFRKALSLDPENFILATRFAECYYGLLLGQPPETEAARTAQAKLRDDALVAWQSAFKIARDDIERQGVLIHFARLKINGSRFDDARLDLAGVTNAMFSVTKNNLLKRLASDEAKIRSTNAPVTSPNATK